MSKNSVISFIIILTIMLSKAQTSYSQNKNINSILTFIKKDKEDTNKVIHLNKLSREYANNGNYNSAMEYGHSALKLALQLNFKKGTASSYNNIGIAYMYQGDFRKALDYYFKALKVDEEIKDKSGMAKHLCNIGIVYSDQGDYPKTLEYYFKALKMAEELGDKNGIATDLGNIGLVYWNQADNPKALDYDFKALKIDKELGHKNEIAKDLGNIGLVFKSQGDLTQEASLREVNYSEALKYYFQALKMAEEIGDKNGIATDLGNIGGVYSAQKDCAKALDYYLKALKLSEEIGDKNTITIWLGSIGSIYTSMIQSVSTSEKKVLANKAEKYLLQALTIDTTIGYLPHEEDTHEQFSSLYMQTGNYKKALEHYKKAMVIKDTLFNQNKNKEITRKEMNYEFEKKETATKAEHIKELAVAAADRKRQRLFLLLVAAVAIAVGIIALIILRSLRITRKQKNIIEEQKHTVEKQKELVEEKQKEILDSIHYAKRIQRSILPTEKYIDKNLKRLMKN
jgi:tetratricopeptide (TPR) repeat protein